MNALIRIPTPLRAFAGGHAEVAVAASTVGGALAELTARYPALRRHLYADDGRLRGFVNVYLNEEDARRLDGEGTPVAAGDVITIVPSIAGGGGASSGGGPVDGRGAAAGSGAEEAPLPELEPPELARYARHIIMPEVGREGQRRLKAARVLLVGAGGLGSPAALYLAAAGVGTLGVVEFDVVDESNLQRQVLYGTADVGRPKVEAAAERLRGVNPHVRVVPHPVRLTGENALEVLAGYDLVVDGTDNFPTRYLVNDACVLTGKPYVYGSIFRFEGQVSVFAAEGGPCYRCLFREPPPPGLVPSCAEGGVLGVLPGIVGSIQALEAIKLILGRGDTLVGRLLLFDALAMRWRELWLRRDPACPVCGDEPTITAPIDYDAFCGVAPGGAGPAEEDGVPELGPRELKARLERGDPLVLVDVREPGEWEVANLAPYGARLVPVGELGDRLGELDPGSEVVLYCRSGLRSARALRQLRAAGFRRVWNLRGGILAWADEVDPSLPRY